MPTALLRTKKNVHDSKKIFKQTQCYSHREDTAEAEERVLTRVGWPVGPPLLPWGIFPSRRSFYGRGPTSNRSLHGRHAIWSTPPKRWPLVCILPPGQVSQKKDLRPAFTMDEPTRNGCAHLTQVPSYYCKYFLSRFQEQFTRTTGNTKDEARSPW